MLLCKSIICPIHKNVDRITGTFLLCIAYKVFTTNHNPKKTTVTGRNSYLINTKQCDGTIMVHATGFRTGISGTDQLFTVKQQCKTYCTAVNYYSIQTVKKAFSHTGLGGMSTCNIIRK